MIITTSICANYLDKALVLLESVKVHCPGATFVLCLVEDKMPKIDELKKFDRVVLAKELGIDHFKNFIFQYDIVEASTAVKGHLMVFLLKQYPQENSVYIDPDCQVFSDLIELKSISDEAPIVLAPHLLEPGNIEMEISSLKHGVFNLGFLALKPGAEALKFAQWWADRLYHFSVADFERGLFTDQKWINLAPCFFNVNILRHPGFDFATWSFMERQLSKSESSLSTPSYLVNGEPLRFVHFSGFDSGTFAWARETWGSLENKKLGLELEFQYKQKLAQFAHIAAKKIPWSYASYADGTPVAKASRKHVGKNFGHCLSGDPFVDKIVMPKKSWRSTRLFGVLKTIKNGARGTLRKLKTAF